MASTLIRARWFDRKERSSWAPPAWSASDPAHLDVTGLRASGVVHLSPWPVKANGQRAFGNINWGDGISNAFISPGTDPNLSGTVSRNYLQAGTYTVVVTFGPGVSGTPSNDAATFLRLTQQVTVTGAAARASRKSRKTKVKA